MFFHKIQDSFTETSIPLKEIVVNKDFMMRDGIDKQMVERYKENLSEIIESEPITVFETPNGLMLVDGFHRLSAARQLDWSEIKVRKYKGSVQDAFAFACLANLKHGKPLSRSERERAVKEYIVLNAELSDRWIAKDTGLHWGTISRWRKELENDGRIKPVEKRLGQDDKERTVANATVETPMDPFEEWFKTHVIEGDVFDVLPNDPFKYDLMIIDPPYGITNESWDKQTKFDLLNFTKKQQKAHDFKRAESQYNSCCNVDGHRFLKN